MKLFGYLILFLIVFIGITIVVRSCSTATKYVENGIETAYQEYKPEELLRKYEWFKDAAASLDAKIANLEVYKGRFESLKESYGEDSLKRRNWNREDAQQWSIWQSECSGIAASYNDLAAQYNSEMAKFNWRFTNRGTMPAGAQYDKVLPREYKPYIYSF